VKESRDVVFYEEIAPDALEARPTFCAVTTLPHSPQETNELASLPNIPGPEYPPLYRETRAAKPLNTSVVCISSQRDQLAQAWCATQEELYSPMECLKSLSWYLHLAVNPGPANNS